MTASSIATGATQLLVTRTARLRAAMRQIDPYSAALVATVVAVLLALILRSDPAPTASQSPVIVFATPPLSVSAPARKLADRVSAGARDTVTRSAPVAPLQPVPAPPAAPEQQPVQVLQVQQQIEPTSAPAATAESHWEGNSYVINGSTVPTVAPADLGRVDSQGWVCGKPYGDWRDSDPMYTHPECYPVREGK